MVNKPLLGLLSVLVATVGYIPYIRDILRHKTKPHALSWLVWTVLSAIGFAVQITHNGGAGSWLLGFTALVTLIIFVLSLQYGETKMAVADVLSFISAAIALLLWLITNDPLASVILISLIDAVGGFMPTFRKSFFRPHEETASLYLIYAVSLVLSLLALDSFTVVNALYPASFVGINSAMVAFLYVRRKQLA